MMELYHPKIKQKMFKTSKMNHSFHEEKTESSFTFKEKIIFYL